MSGIINGAGSKSGVIGETELDYEEGTYTPSTSFIDNVGSASGTYVKVGRMVTIHVQISPTAGNDIRISTSQNRGETGNLPFVKSPTYGGLACVEPTHPYYGSYQASSMHASGSYTPVGWNNTSYDSGYLRIGMHYICAE